MTDFANKARARMSSLEKKGFGALKLPRKGAPAEPEASARRWVLITGASSGIGEAFARLYAERDCNLALTGRNRHRLDALAEELRIRCGVAVVVHAADLGDPRTPSRLFDALQKKRIGVDVLVANAGSALHGDFLERSWEESRAYLDVMLISICRLIHLFAPAMKSRGYGRIIVTSSVSGFMPNSSGVPLYSPIKGFLNKLAWSLDSVYAPHGVRVVAVCPGFTRTAFQERGGMAGLADAVPGFLWMDARDVAAAAIAAAERKGAVHVIGLRYKLIVFLMRFFPDRLLVLLTDLRNRRAGVGRGVSE